MSEKEIWLLLYSAILSDGRNNAADYADIALQEYKDRYPDSDKEDE